MALVDKNQPQNGRCRATFSTLSLPLITTWPALTEAVYLVYRIGGWSLQLNLWTYIERGLLQLHSPREEVLLRMKQFMEQYRDTPMDFADASLVAAAEALNLTRIFTLDSDFYVYRINGTTPFEVVP